MKVRTRKKYSAWIWFVIFVILVVIAWGIGSYYVGSRAQSILDGLVGARSVQADGYRLVQKDVHRGIWVTKGNYVLVSGEGNQTHEHPVRIAYELNHALLPNRLATVGVQLDDGDDAAILLGDGILDWDGIFEGELAMPAHEREFDGKRVRIGAMEGVLRAAPKEGIAIDMLWPRIDQMGVHKAFDLENVHLTGTWVPGQCEGRHYQMTMENVRLPEARLQNLVLESDVNCAASDVGRLDVTLNTAADSIEMAMATFDDWTGELVWLDLDQAATRELANGWLQEMLSPGHVGKSWWQGAAQTLVFDGLQTELRNFGARTALGRVSGQASLLVKPLPEQAREARPVPFDAYLESSGDLRLTDLNAGSLLAMVTGLFERFDQGLRLHYTFKDKELVLNGHELPSAILRDGINDLVNEWLGLPLAD